MYGYILAFLSGTCTGLTVAVGKVSAQHLSASMYVFLISFLSLIMMYVWRSLTVTWRINLPPPGVRGPLFWQSAFSAFALWGFWEGARQINTGVASFAVRTELVFVLIASWIFFKEKIEKIGVLGALLILLGSVAMGFRPDEQLMIEAGQNPAIYTYGISIVILSGAGFAASECFAKIIANRIEPSALVMWRGLFLGLVFLVMVMIEDGIAAFQRVTAMDWIICSAAALLGPVFARVLFMISLRKIDLGKAYLICQNEPIVTAVFAWVLIGEKMSPGNITGAVLILIGCVVISLPGLAKLRQSV
jgi:drug/metabolite transporter (DMT)-like permease